MNQMAEEYKFETFVDPPGEADGIIALVCDTADAAKLVLFPNGESPTRKAYGVLEFVGGAKFKDIQFNFDFALPRYRHEQYRKDFIAVLREVWLLQVVASEADHVSRHVSQAIDCLEVALNGMASTV